MLVLTRKLMEKLYIGDEICLTIVRLEAGQVRLGIEAPRHVSVVRAELRRHAGPAGLAAVEAPAPSSPGTDSPRPGPSR